MAQTRANLGLTWAFPNPTCFGGRLPRRRFVFLGGAALGYERSVILVPKVMDRNREDAARRGSGSGLQEPQDVTATIGAIQPIGGASPRGLSLPNAEGTR